ncbi:MAG: M23 family metallopeptidase [Solirubrobacterales bacterium]
MRRLLVTGVALVALPLLGGGGAVAAKDPVTGSAQALGFQLDAHRVGPKRPLFDGRKQIKLSFRFSANRPADLRILVTDRRSGKTVARWRQGAAEPGTRLRRRWNGVNRRGRSVDDGRYEFRVGPLGRPARFAGGFKIHGHVFPVDGPHGDRGAIGEFGAPRNGGRIHEGFDILAGCGTPLVAARGGRVRKVGYDGRLYGWFVLISGRKSSERYFYSHLIARPPIETGDRIYTGDRVGRVGQTGNAASTPCHLHFELRKGDRPIDPKRALRGWDRWS